MLILNSEFFFAHDSYSVNTISIDLLQLLKHLHQTHVSLLHVDQTANAVKSMDKLYVLAYLLMLEVHLVVDLNVQQAQNVPWTKLV